MCWIGVRLSKYGNAVDSSFLWLCSPPTPKQPAHGLLHFPLAVHELGELPE